MDEIKVLGMRVGWHIGWTNLPDLHMLLEKPLPKAEHRRLIAVQGGNYLLCRQAPVVRYTFESEYGGGALGIETTLEDGTIYKTNGGWSSNAGQINRLRALDPRFADYLPYDVIEITVYGEYAREGTYNNGWGLGLAGAAFDLPWAEKKIREHLPGLKLLDLNDRRPGRNENQASAEQAAIIGVSSSAYGYIPVPAGLEEIGRETIKPDVESELFARTAMGWDRKRAAQEAAKVLAVDTS